MVETAQMASLGQWKAKDPWFKSSRHLDFFFFYSHLLDPILVLRNKRRRLFSQLQYPQDILYLYMLQCGHLDDRVMDSSHQSLLCCPEYIKKFPGNWQVVEHIEVTVMPLNE